jgi:hypothetical protein
LISCIVYTTPFVVGKTPYVDAGEPKEVNMTASTDPWDVLDDSGSQPTVKTSTAERLEPLAEEYVKLKSEFDALQIRLGQIENEIAYLFPEEAGEIAQSTPRFEIVVSRSERWSWDKEALLREFPTGEHPDYIKNSLSVDKRKFQKLPEFEQQRLKHALTRKLDNPKVKVIPNV